MNFTIRPCHALEVRGGRNKGDKIMIVMNDWIRSPVLLVAAVPSPNSVILSNTIK
jgi:hypothetical protein